MFPQFQMIRDFDQLDKFDQQETKFQSLIFHKQELFKQTQDNQTQNHQVLPTRSIKNKISHFQTTFSLPMINQHSFAFKKLLQKFMEKSFSNFKKLQIKNLSHEIFDSDQINGLGEQKLNQIIIKDNRLFEQKQKRQFLTDLYYEQKLSEFLTMVCNNCHSQLASDLIYIANLFWQVYLPKQEIGLTEEQIKKIVEQLLDSQNSQQYLQKVEYLNLKKATLESQLSEFQIKYNLKQFIRKYGITLLLVMQQYFHNPYFKDEQEQVIIKRPISFRDISNDQFSDDEQEVNFCGKKKRKI